MRRLLARLRRSRPVKTWHVIDADSPMEALRSLGFMPARTRREACARAHECWPGVRVAAWQITPKVVAEVYAEAMATAVERERACPAVPDIAR